MTLFFTFRGNCFKRIFKQISPASNKWCGTVHHVLRRTTRCRRFRFSSHHQKRHHSFKRHDGNNDHNSGLFYSICTGIWISFILQQFVFLIIFFLDSCFHKCESEFSSIENTCIWNTFCIFILYLNSMKRKHLSNVFCNIQGAK